jgi:hypothetical protein
VLDVYGEVVGPAGELDQSGMLLPAIDQELMTRELWPAAVSRRQTLGNIDRIGHVWTGRETSAVGPDPTRIRRSDDDGIVIESLSTTAVTPHHTIVSSNDYGGRRGRRYSAHAVREGVG